MQKVESQINWAPGKFKLIENAQTNEKIIAVFKFDSSGNRIDIDLHEHAQTLNHPAFISVLEQERPKISVSPRSMEFPVFFYNYTESDSYIGIGQPDKVTPDVAGPATISTGSSVTKSQSFGGGISINFEIRKTIKAGSSFTYTTSVSSATNFGASFSIPSGRIGYVQFRAYYDVTVGTLRETIVYNGQITETDYDAWGQSPRKAGSFADGLYELVLK